MLLKCTATFYFGWTKFQLLANLYFADLGMLRVISRFDTEGILILQILNKLVNYVSSLFY